MTTKKIAIIAHSDAAEQLAQQIQFSNSEIQIYRSPKNMAEIWKDNQALIFIGSLGICVRTIAPFLEDKKTDPAVINIDANGQFVQPVVSGHVGGANELAKELAGILGATPTISTVSDTSELWALDTLPKRFDWQLECEQLTQIIARFVNKKPIALLLDVRDKGTLFLESSLPEHVQPFYQFDDIVQKDFSAIIVVSPFIYPTNIPVLYYRPKVLCLGIGAQSQIQSESFAQTLGKAMLEKHLSPLSIQQIGTVELKKDEPAFIDFANSLGIELQSFAETTLADYLVPNPSEKVQEVTGSTSVAEATAMHLSKNNLLIEKTKGQAADKYFTWAIAIDKAYERKGHIEIVGAGPGDPELVSVRGKNFLSTADLILYAGSLVPKELTLYAKPGCVVKSSAGMDLQTQIDTMKPFYDRGLLVVRLHTGDPCIYGAIQEQMAIMDELNMTYHITPGISSFQAAAAALKSQFTIPEEVQSIILTRGEGRTPMPEKEQLHKLAQSQSTMCIYLSAAIAEKVQQELMEHYPAETPVAICYKLTWKEEKIWRTTLEKLASTIAENKLSMTTMIVVGKAIDNRSGESKLYHKQFTHAFRKGEE